MSELWRECLVCKSNCCNCEIASYLFVTQDEIMRMTEIFPDKMAYFSKVMPCPLLTEDQLCQAHEVKPIDCRLFPFDIIKDNDNYLWVIRQLDCLILENKDNYEEYLKDFEEKIIPNFVPYIDEYALYRFDELSEKFKFHVLRKVRMEDL